MEAYEAAFLEAILDDGASIATCMREERGTLVAGPERLTADGQRWLRGYLAGQLSMVRASTVGNPSLSADDLDLDLVDRLYEGGHDPAVAERRAEWLEKLGIPMDGRAGERAARLVESFVS